MDGKFISMRKKSLILAGCLIAAIAGCGDNAGRREYLEQEFDNLRTQVSDLKSQAEQYQDKIEQLKKQNQTLSGLKPELKAENLYRIEFVKMHKYTNLYDKNKDGKKETLIVYILPTDTEGDVIKASGAVDVELWDLNRENSNAKLAQWRVEPADLRKNWYSSIATSSFRLMFDVSEIVQNDDMPLTVKVAFTDYLTGKVFNEQIVTKP
jgi:outer membrane murein-binding lipoprotein Lpp